MAVDTFIPEVWSARILEALQKAHIATALCNTDYQGEITKMGDTVHIGSIGDITVKDYTKNKDIDAPEDLNLTDTTLLIDSAKYFNFQVDDIDTVQAAGPLMDSASRNAAYQVADAVDKAIFAKMIAEGTDFKSGKATATALTASNAYEYLVALRTAMVKANVPAGTWEAAVPPEFTGLLLTDDRFVKAGTDASEDRLQNGYVGKAAGFKIFETNNLSTNVIATYPGATAFAEQITEVNAYRPEKRFADAVKGLDVYGVKVVRPTAVIVGTVSF